MTTRNVAVLIGRQPVERYSVHRGYVDAVWAVDAVPLLVPAGPGADLDRCLAVLNRVDGVLATGGGDVDPSVYGEQAGDRMMEVDPERDRVEVAIVRAARRRGIPVLGICRGIQLMAASLGGALVKDLPTAGHDGHWEEDKQYQPVHSVEADANSLASMALAGAIEVNSIHHQAVADPGPDLRASAWSADGVIEAIEGAGALGVQWHPERLLEFDRRHLAPFRWLVSA
ncbi:MAG: gamma-glutamyl-gamma-aminobutyrate hydrolase family protein [Actinobacteria bacterium]|nr:gamma-glutamyl-gamma-aminobutyrate hydrolase family protein [Actinomycetota bacterium]